MDILPTWRLQMGDISKSRKTEEPGVRTEICNPIRPLRAHDSSAIYKVTSVKGILGNHEQYYLR
jgi:hypothetical protein